MSDWIFASIAMLGLLAFMGIVNYYVMEPDLWVVSLAILGIAVWFTWQDLKSDGSHLEGESDEGSDR